MFVFVHLIIIQGGKWTFVNSNSEFDKSDKLFITCQFEFLLSCWDLKTEKEKKKKVCWDAHQRDTRSMRKPFSTPQTLKRVSSPSLSISNCFIYLFFYFYIYFWLLYLLLVPRNILNVLLYVPLFIWWIICYNNNT